MVSVAARLTKGNTQTSRLSCNTLRGQSLVFDSRKSGKRRLSRKAVCMIWFRLSFQKRKDSRRSAAADSVEPRSGPALVTSRLTHGLTAASGQTGSPLKDKSKVRGDF